MRYRRLGTTDLMVSEISLGSLVYSGETPLDQAKRCVHRAMQLGINFFDTANMYGRGVAEEFLGDALKPFPRHEYLLATKVYFPMSDTDKGLSREQIEKQLDASLARLGTHYIDLYQCHRYDEETPLEETMEALTDAVRRGKVRYIGFSEWPIDRIRQALEIPGVARFVSSQPQYSMLWRVPEAELFPFCEQTGLGQLVYSPLTQGVLTGKYQPGSMPPAGSRATHSYMKDWIGDWLQLHILEAVQSLSMLAQEAGMTSSQLALAWILRNPNVTAALTGATNPRHVNESAAVSGMFIPEDLMQAADQIIRPVAAV